MKRILFFLESLGSGGAEKVLSDLVRNLDKDKYDVTVCTVIDGGVYQPVIERHCRYYSMMKQSDYDAGGLRKVLHWASMKRIYSQNPEKVYQKYIKDEYDIEVAFLEGFATKLIAASSNKKSKKVCWVHIDMVANSYADNSYNSLEDERRVYLAFDEVLAVSKTVKASMTKKFGIENIHVQYNPIDSKQINEMADERIKHHTEETGIRLVTVGRLEFQKGYDRLLSVLKRIKKEGYPVSVTIVGTGSMENQLKEYAIQNGLENDVLFTGYQTNPYPYIKAADAFICSSRAEGYSTVATEALILGVPVFTTDCSGMRELFGDERCGEIVPNTDDDLYDMIKRLVSGKTDLAKYRKSVNKRAKAFGIEIRMKEIEEKL